MPFPTPITQLTQEVVDIHNKYKLIIQDGSQHIIDNFTKTLKRPYDTTNSGIKKYVTQIFETFFNIKLKLKEHWHTKRRCFIKDGYDRFYLELNFDDKKNKKDDEHDEDENDENKKYCELQQEVIIKLCELLANYIKKLKLPYIDDIDISVEDPHSIFILLDVKKLL